MQAFDASNFNEHKKKQTEDDIPVIPHDSTISLATALKILLIIQQ